ncbi:hypothetical protein Csa_021737 [Cucumis sativus]|uniref:Uncharacterized protein n=1 Tax=Cucumis sativus TaxID=3659 RepID=A0A0A0KI19_CUCSA|nr:hypothetical protein Csa_021737 [Cucumis sativus]
MGRREREIIDTDANLARIGIEGFKLIDKFFGRASTTGGRRVVAATEMRPAQMQPPRKVAEQPPSKTKEKQGAVVTSDHLAKTRGGIVITTWRSYAKRK